MAQFTGSSRRGISTKLPTTKSKIKGKRRRGLTGVCLDNNIRLALLFLLAIFIIGIVKYGIPSPLSSKSPVPVRPWNKPVTRTLTSSVGFNLSEARVDITTKRLYDKIEFLDIDGGAWKQGWQVSYKGDEWDREKLKVFVVPHSHNDPGWLLTVEEYYLQKTRHILDSVIQALLKDSRRKFIWEEMSYLERWWRDASNSNKRDLIKLVKAGQLEIVGGGWVMNDEVLHSLGPLQIQSCGIMWRLKGQ